MASRREKYPDTKTFTYYNANPKNRMGGDCVIRAVCTALEQPWEQTIRELTEVGIKNGFVVNDKNTYSKYLEQKGWTKHKQPKKTNGTKYTGEEFCKKIADKNKNYVANIGGNHVVCIKNGKVHDIWDSTDGCIGNYWVKEA